MVKTNINVITFARPDFFSIFKNGKKKLNYAKDMSQFVHFKLKRIRTL